MFVYGLRDPQNNEIRYVGRTSNLKRRYTEHLLSSRTSSDHKRNWIKSLLNAGIKPELVVLASANSEEELVKLEDQFISKYSNLTNSSWRGAKAGCIPGASRTESRKTIIATCLKTGVETVFKGIYSVPAPFKGDSISKCLNGQCVSHAGYSWRYASNNEAQQPRVKSEGYGVLKLNLDGSVATYYLKVTDAVKDGFYSSGIQRCAQGFYTQHKGFKWKFASKEDKIKYTGNSVKEAFQRNKKGNN